MKKIIFLIMLLIIPNIVLASEPTLLNYAQDTWEMIIDNDFEYGGTNIPPIKQIDSSAYVCWVLYEAGYKEFATQVTTTGFINTNWQEKYGWEEITVDENENVTSILKAGDILVRDNGDGGSSGHMNIIVSVDSGKVMAYDAGSRSNWQNSNGNPIDKTEFAKSDKRKGKIIRIKSLNLNSTADKASCNNKGDFPKYNLTEEQLKYLAYICYRNKGTLESVAAEASLMANLFELKGNGYGSGAEGLYNYVKNSGWFSGAKEGNTTDNQDVISVVKTVLVDGKRTLPKYIDEMDNIIDLKSITVNDLKFLSKTNLNYPNNFVPYKTLVENQFGNSYYFYNLLNNTIYGYTNEDNKSNLGNDCYVYSLGSSNNKEKTTKNPTTSVLSLIGILICFGGAILFYIFIDRKNYFKKIN